MDTCQAELPAALVNPRVEELDAPTVAVNYRREITIKAVLNGFTVRVGCQTLVFENQTYMIAELQRYLSNPSDIEKEYLTKGAK